MSRDIAKTLSFLSVHLVVGFTVAYLLTGSIAVAGGIALIEPCVNAVAFYFHDRAWSRDWSGFSLRDLIHVHGHAREPGMA
ncbi:DUF2061 domain-containing protein [Sphingomonas sanxanigenens]|uniref:DUF2061 domain-containing protein n=1 Tax=Sphingomonas sanxanigenens DSM 19645 = NX02 TaxID=1123269 RepID=W0ACQ9_9SPHN|nr:DUF2061 domain-containing protein [Sphingomonas sanxanigenens]AHE54332.1 hypothetical protein NX02_13170 [Sphingomonas sanxanigenens DSM 19645 = NX02]